MRAPILFAVAAALAGCGGNNAAQTTPIDTIVPVDVADLVGARGSSGETEMKSRGYEITRTDGLTAYWWNGGRGSCVRVVTADGRYQSVDPVPPTQCSSTAGKSTATATPLGGTPPDLVTMVGANAGQAEMGMQNSGYTATRTQGLTTYWWNQSTGVCAQVVTSDGRYKTISAVTPGECQA
jgi:hypothetical protein